MSNSFDREKVVECMFDPTTASILAALEDGEKRMLIFSRARIYS